jgi:hypothetical protein
MFHITCFNLLRRISENQVKDRDVAFRNPVSLTRMYKQ